MVTPQVTGALTLLSGLVIGISVYLIKDKLESAGDEAERKAEHVEEQLTEIQVSIDELQNEIERNERLIAEEREIVIQWLVKLTKSLNKIEGTDVDIPDEVYMKKGLDVDDEF